MYKSIKHVKINKRYFILVAVLVVLLFILYYVNRVKEGITTNRGGPRAMIGKQPTQGPSGSSSGPPPGPTSSPTPSPTPQPCVTGISFSKNGQCMTYSDALTEMYGKLNPDTLSYKQLYNIDKTCGGIFLHNLAQPLTSAAATMWTDSNYVNGDVYTLFATNMNTVNAIEQTYWAKNVQCPKPHYRVSYNPNADPGSTTGSVPIDSSSPYTDGSAVVVLGNTGNLTKIGNTFGGWSISGKTQTYSAGSTFTINEDTILNAVWNPSPGQTTYMVRYYGNRNTGGAAPTDVSSPYTANSQVTILGKGQLVRDGYTFVGWNTVADRTGGISYVEGDKFTLTQNINLYAQWVLTTYRVTYFSLDSTSGTLPSDSTSYTAGSTVTVLGSGNLVKTGYNFAGWAVLPNLSQTYSPNDTFIINQNTNLRAQWTAGYTVTYDGSRSDGGSPPVDSSSYSSGQTVTVLGLNTLTKPNSYFVGWVDDNNFSYNPGDTFTITSNTRLTAYWAEQYCINVRPQNPASNNPASNNPASNNPTGGATPVLVGL